MTQLYISVKYDDSKADPLTYEGFLLEATDGVREILDRKLFDKSNSANGLKKRVEFDWNELCNYVQENFSKKDLEIIFLNSYHYFWADAKFASPNYTRRIWDGIKK